ncbi:MAG: hypothetical protein DRP03_02410 [Candidatus Aenigmatarchaeota archaeon]|nr:MAG: hypothetical protein DRP03_02410 [Candidatus Aenigmarchaeota archaeon]
MRKERIPFVPLPLERMRKISRRFFGFGEIFSGMFPRLEWEIDQTGYDLNEVEWVSIAIYVSLFYTLSVFAFLFFVTVIAHIEFMRSITVSLFCGMCVGIFTFIYILFYPKMFVRKRVKGIEENLSPALHHMLIQIRSGIPLFNTLIYIARSDYGELSKVFQRAVNEIQTGKSEIEALEKIARENPSLNFRRVIWQIVNALKTGADIGETMKEIIENLTNEQIIAIKRYGSQLNPIALMYMMLAVIFPTLGVTFVLILSMFMGLPIDMNVFFYAVLILLVIFQFFIITIIKSKRPLGI